MRFLSALFTGSERVIRRADLVEATDPRKLSWIGVAGLLVLSSACGSDDAELNTTGPNTTGPSTTSPSGSNYCADLDELSRLLDDGGTTEAYNALLTRIVAKSPSDHAATWSLMLVLSEEPFTYENFNPAVDELDRLDPDLAVTCPELGRTIVDDSGRIRSFPTG